MGGGKGGGGGISDKQIEKQLASTEGLAERAIAEGARRYDQDFSESTRRFGEDTRRYDQGFGEDVRRYDAGQTRLDDSIGRGIEAGNQMSSLLSSPAESLGAYEQAIIDQATPGQERAANATRSALARQGVRGPQAALEEARQSGMMQQGLQNRLAGTRFEEEMNRRSQLGQYLGNRSLQGLGGRG